MRRKSRLAVGVMVVWAGVVWAGDDAPPLLIDPKTLPPGAVQEAPAKGDGKGAVGGPTSFPEEEAWRAFRAGAYAQVVTLKGSSCSAAELTMCGESYLHLGDGPSAAPEFLKAAKWTQDAEQRDLLIATAYLCKHLNGVQYLAKTTDEKGEPVANWAQPRPVVAINVMDTSNRPAALKAFYYDLLHSATGWLERAKVGTVMWRYDEAITEYKELIVVEWVTMGTHEQSQQLQKKIISALNATVSEALSAREKRVAVLREKERTGMDPGAASAIVEHGGGEYHPLTPTKPPRSGLVYQDWDEVRNIGITAHRVAPAMKSYAKDLGVEEKEFSGVEEQASRLEAASNELLKQSYDDSQLSCEEKKDRQ